MTVTAVLRMVDVATDLFKSCPGAAASLPVAPHCRRRHRPPPPPSSPVLLPPVVAVEAVALAAPPHRSPVYEVESCILAHLTCCD
jgi:hypothetical protein